MAPPGVNINYMTASPVRCEKVRAFLATRKRSSEGKEKGKKTPKPEEKMICSA